MKNKLLSIALLVLLCGCDMVSPKVALMEAEYKTRFGQAVCLTTQKLNERKILGDKQKLASEFELVLQQSMVELGFDVEEMLAAKAKYLTEEESEKLLRLHLVWCLMNAGLEKIDNDDATVIPNSNHFDAAN